MSAAIIMDAILTKIKAVLSESDDLLAGEVTSERAEELNTLLSDAMSAGWTEGLRAWLTTAESDADTIEKDGVVYRYKLDSEKEFLTPGGMLTLTRRVYQPDKGGKCRIPVEVAWGMEGQFATTEVRDAALYAVALCTPLEAETLLDKCSLFQPSSTAINRMAANMGRWLEEHEDEVLESKASPTRRKALATEQTFFRRNAHRMEYARFRRNGWPIGSGPIEAACKSVVKTRLCRSGMRWSRTGGQHILGLRTYVKSQRWNGMWRLYKQIERTYSTAT